MKPPSPKRMAVWRHNSHIGCAVMMQGQCQNILSSPTATNEAKAAANEIYTQARVLEAALRTERKES